MNSYEPKSYYVGNTKCFIYPIMDIEITEKNTTGKCEKCEGDLDYLNSKGRVCMCRCKCGWIYNRCYKTYTNGKCKHIK